MQQLIVFTVSSKQLFSVLVDSLCTQFKSCLLMLLCYMYMLISCPELSKKFSKSNGHSLKFFFEIIYVLASHV